ncbi:MAG: hypothetical protein J3R72DRAFT_501122 [Linnemannia gamsii]|nr:MAG: hypothetical protein J3R72DRAFT_501122 [Linnemannia gamsii]
MLAEWSAIFRTPMSIAKTVLHKFVGYLETQASELIWKSRCSATIAWEHTQGISAKDKTSKYTGPRGDWSQGFSCDQRSLSMTEMMRVHGKTTAGVPYGILFLRWLQSITFQSNRSITLRHRLEIITQDINYQQPDSATRSSRLNAGCVPCMLNAVRSTCQASSQTLIDISQSLQVDVAHQLTLSNALSVAVGDSTVASNVNICDERGPSALPFKKY